jgi:hypothetical protein
MGTRPHFNNWRGKVVRSPRTGPSPFAQCAAAAAQAPRHSRRPGGFRVHKRVDHRVGPVEVSLQDPVSTQRVQGDALVPGRVRRHHLWGQRQVVSLGAPDVRAEPAPHGGPSPALAPRAPGGQLEQRTQTRDLRPQPPQLATATGRPRSTRSRISLTLTTVRARNPLQWLPDSSRRTYFRSCRTHVRWSAVHSGYPEHISSR